MSFEEERTPRFSHSSLIITCGLMIIIRICVESVSEFFFLPYRFDDTKIEH